MKITSETERTNEILKEMDKIKDDIKDLEQEFEKDE